MRILAALLLLATHARAAEIELRYSALEHILAAQLFTQEGRHYVRGSRSAHCDFAYLENPKVDAVYSRLRVRARFSGRSAIDLFGGCVGMGDSFDLTITALPVPRGTAIALTDVHVEAARDSYYIRRVRAALARSIARDFKIELTGQARKLIEQSTPVYQQSLDSLQLTEVRLTADALVLVVDFRVVVK